MTNTPSRATYRSLFPAKQNAQNDQPRGQQKPGPRPSENTAFLQQSCPEQLVYRCLAGRINKRHDPVGAPIETVHTSFPPIQARSSPSNARR
jgi:hypothetical protein